MDSDCLDSDSPIGSLGGRVGICQSDKTCAGIHLGGKCGGKIAPDSFFGCEAGAMCNLTGSAGVCAPRIAEWEICFPETLLPSIREVLGGEVASTLDPCARGAICAGSPGKLLGKDVPSRCVPFGFFQDGTDIAHLRYIPGFFFKSLPPGPVLASALDALLPVALPHEHHEHNASNTITGPNLICSSGFAMAVALNNSHYSLQCSDPVSSKYLTNNIGQPCDLEHSGVNTLPYYCVPGLGQGMSSQLAAPWQWRDDAVGTILALAQCRFGSLANDSSTASGHCSRTSSMSPGSCAYYACFDLMAQFTCLGTGLIWDRATWEAFQPGVPECFADQVHLPEDVFACVWRGQHMANCTELPGIGAAAGTCPYRPATDLSDSERDGITIAIVLGVVGVIVTGVAAFALRGARAKQWSERSRAWRQGGAELDYSAIDVESSDGGAVGSARRSASGRHASGDRPLSLNGGGERPTVGEDDEGGPADDVGYYSKAAANEHRR